MIPIDFRVETSELAEKATPMVAEAHRWNPNIFFLESTNTTTSKEEGGWVFEKRHLQRDDGAERRTSETCPSLRASELPEECLRL